MQLHRGLHFIHFLRYSELPDRPWRTSRDNISQRRAVFDLMQSWITRPLIVVLVVRPWGVSWENKAVQLFAVRRSPGIELGLVLRASRWSAKYFMVLPCIVLYCLVLHCVVLYRCSVGKSVISNCNCCRHSNCCTSTFGWSNIKQHPKIKLSQ